QPVLKLTAKTRVDGRTGRTYDQAATSYRRVLALDTLPLEIKARLAAQYVQLNPMAPRAAIDAKVALLK
ncbi:MAG TPA: integrase, partial [Alphaproteobacteria bacterium]|nr:integrase [Alphaproteobacteria bacterium]